MNMVVEHYEENFNRLVKRVAYRVGGPTNAQDVVQEAYTRALAYLDSYKAGEEFGAWFNTILNNSTKDFQNDERHQGMSWSTIPEDALGSYEMDDSEWLDGMIKGRSEGEQAILRLYFHSGFTQSDIAHTVNYTQQNISLIIKRFIKEVEHG